MLLNKRYKGTPHKRDRSRTSHVVMERRLKVSELLKKRLTHQAIASRLGVERSVITKDIKAIQNEWASQCIDNIHLVRLRELADLEDMERECIARLEGLQAHPHQGSRWMEERRKIKERRAKMLGLDTEQRFSIKKEVTYIDKAKRDEVILAALGDRLPPEIIAAGIKQLSDANDVQDAEYEEE